jgi:hypothetical protein
MKWLVYLIVGTFAAILYVASVFLFGLLLEISWNGSMVPMGLPHVAYGQACWFIVLVSILRVILLPTSIVPKAKTTA